MKNKAINDDLANKVRTIIAGMKYPMTTEAIAKAVIDNKYMPHHEFQRLKGRVRYRLQKLEANHEVGCLGYYGHYSVALFYRPNMTLE